MRQPTFRSRRTRQQRLLRTAIVLVVIVAAAALIANFVGGGKKSKTAPEPGAAQVAFQVRERAETDGPLRKRPQGTVVKQESGQIATILNGWYQRAYVNVKDFGDGTFTDLAANFAKGAAQTAFKRDINSLTIGAARPLVSRVDPEVQTAVVTVFYQKGKTPVFAVVDVHFEARGTPKDKTAQPIKIRQHGVYHFQKENGTWVIIYYDAKQTEKSIQPSPTATASS